MRRFLLAMVCGSLLLPLVVLAETKTPIFDIFSLQADARAEVANDYMEVSLVAEGQEKDSAELADKINSVMQWALSELETFSALEYSTGNYQTWPVYADKHIVGWRSSQTLRLGGADFEQAGKAVQKLQSRLQVRSMQFRPQDDTRSDAEDDLITEALDNFKRRAAIVQQTMGASGYRVVQLDIHAGAPGIAPRMHMETMSRSSARVATAPAVEAGESTLSVTVSGQIQLQ